MTFGAEHIVTRNQTNPMHNLSSPAPRITPADVSANIVSEHYFTAQDGRRGALFQGTYVGSEKPQIGDMDLAPLTLLTFCVLVLKNGFTVTGKSACVSPQNFDAEIGRRIARTNAEQKIWPLMGYALKEKLSCSPTPAVLPHPLKDFYG